MTLHLVDPFDVAPDLSTAGTLRRYARLRHAGFTIDGAALLADHGYDVIGRAEIVEVSV